MSVWDSIRKFFGRDAPAHSAERVEYLRADFKKRYHHFKLLLTANNTALDRMAEIEEALRGLKPFGMSFVRSRCTAVATNVYQIARHLDQLRPDKYAALLPRFKEIHARINAIVSPDLPPDPGPLVYDLREIDTTLIDQVGGKMAHLGNIVKNLLLDVPDGFAITARAYRRFIEYNDLQAELNRRLQAAEIGDNLEALMTLATSLQSLILESRLPPELENDIGEHYRRLQERTRPDVRVAMRSSSLGEDLPGATSAGQYLTLLNVDGNTIIQAYKQVLASKYSVHAMAYRFARGIRDFDVPMCVGCMRMVEARAGGVMYSRNPLNIRERVVIINAVPGLATAVVDGSEPTDCFLVSRQEPIRLLKATIPSKRRRWTCADAGGITGEALSDEELDAASITEEQALDLGRTAIALEAFYGQPQDIEWAIEPDGRIVLLQCRPLQAVPDFLTPPEAKDVASEPVLSEMTGAGAGAPLLQGGATASPGVGAGPVRVLRREADVLSFPQGAVLVAAQALPIWASLLGRAAAVVTEHGSLTGHLADVAREFGVPALFGVPEALTLLENGRIVTVDADARAVHDGRNDFLLKRAVKPRNLLPGSPVYATLKDAAAHILPLRLLDPDSPDFKPQQCATFHDITRFCHEHRFPERSSKQLYINAPMQFWIIDLDDGFAEGAGQDPHFVQLHEIVSAPMLALWKGMVAIPWAGPPPMNTRGFMSVLIEASSNPNLDPAMPTHYTARNYFMISRNFCSLQSRFGFHFCSVEALVSERSPENYATFKFQGGAANLERRIFRARLVAEILEEYDFRVEVREDSSFARIEGRELPYMEERLLILGYLIMHTRQLDMVMADRAAFRRHAEKIRLDIAKLLENSPSSPQTP